MTLAITDVKILVGDSQEPGFDKDPTNLNKGTSGGTAIYLAFKRDASRQDRQHWVTGLNVIGESDPTPEGWMKDPTDLNLGAGGDSLYLIYEKGGTDKGAVRDIRIVNARYTPVDDMYVGYTFVSQDLNAGASGYWLWLTYLQDPPSDGGSAFIPNGKGKIDVSGTVTTITANNPGVLYAITNDNNVWEYEGVAQLPKTITRWNPIAKNSSVIVTDSYWNIYRIALNGGIYSAYGKSNPITWTQIGDNGKMIATYGEWHAGSVTAHLYCIQKDGSIQKYNGTPNNWTPIGANGKKIAVSGQTGDLYAIMQDGSIQKYNGAPNSWTEIGTDGKDILLLDLAQPELVAVKSNGHVIEYTGTPNSWTQIGIGMSASAITGYGETTTYSEPGRPDRVINSRDLFAIIGNKVVRYAGSSRWIKTDIGSASMIAMMPGWMLCAVLSSDDDSVHYYIPEYGRGWFTWPQG